MHREESRAELPAPTAAPGTVLPFPQRALALDSEAAGASAPRIEEQLLAIVRGDGEATAWLYDTFAADLFRRLNGRYRGQPGVDVEDVLHDAMVFYLQHDAKVLRDYLDRTPAAKRSESSLAEHLWNLACGLVSNRKRAATGRPTHPLLGTSWASGRPDPEEDLISRDELDRLDRCLKKRGERLYLYFKLRYEDGLNPRDIVKATGWSTKATYKRKQALHEALKDCCQRLGSLWRRWRQR
ncbi:MAG: hypothetical protein AAGM22_12370 [Acidobacteriota bacterium]